MRKKCNYLLVALFFLLLTTFVQAQNVNKFEVTKYFSKNREYFVKVTPDKKAVLYRGNKKVRTQILPALPGSLLITNDGKRLIMIENYFGNNNDRKTEVLIFFDEKGDKISGFNLESLADFDNVLHTNTGSSWLDTFEINQSKNELILNTIVLTCPLVENSPKAVDLKKVNECKKPKPKEKITFSTVDGKLISRTDVATAAN